MGSFFVVSIQRVLFLKFPFVKIDQKKLLQQSIADSKNKF